MQIHPERIRKNRNSSNLDTPHEVVLVRIGGELYKTRELYCIMPMLSPTCQLNPRLTLGFAESRFNARDLPVPCEYSIIDSGFSTRQNH